MATGKKRKKKKKTFHVFNYMSHTGLSDQLWFVFYALSISKFLKLLLSSVVLSSLWFCLCYGQHWNYPSYASSFNLIHCSLPLGYNLDLTSWVCFPDLIFLTGKLRSSSVKQHMVYEPCYHACAILVYNYVFH